MDSTIFCSTCKEYKNPIGPIKSGESITIRIRLNQNYSPYNVQLNLHEYCNYSNCLNFSMNFEKEDYEYIYFKIDIYDLNVNIYEYYFSFDSYDSKKFIKRNYDSWDAYVKDDIAGCNWQLTVYRPIKTHPNMNNGIMYQIFPDRFYKGALSTELPRDRIYRKWGELPFYSDDLIGSDFFGGNLNGITEKLEYLKGLGVSVLYFNPIWESQSNHRYDTSNYLNIDPVLGSNEDLKILIDKAHSLDMIIILDAVFNHTGADSIYFNKYNRYSTSGAYNNINSPYRKWYYFNNDGGYDSWWGFSTLPKVNQTNPVYINYFFDEGGVIDKWYELGIDGLRLDVADELKNSTLERIYQASIRNRDFIVIIGEVWENASNKINYGNRMNYFLGKQLSSVMNYPVRDIVLAYIRYGNPWDKVLYNTLTSIFIEDYPREVAYSLMNFLSSHDTVRAITKLAGKEVDNHNKDWQFENDTLSREEYILGRKRLILSYIIVYFLPGIPCIFYGDEIGLYGQKDPFCRKCFSWGKIDKKLLRFFKKIGKLRKNNSNFLSSADYETIEITNDMLIFKRQLENNCIYVFINRSNVCLNISRYSNIMQNFKILLSIGKNTDLQCIDSYGSLILEIFV